MDRGRGQRAPGHRRPARGLPPTAAEIQLDPVTYARLSSETEVSMLELGPEATQVRMTLGLATFRVRRNPDGRHVEIDTLAARSSREAGASPGQRRAQRRHQRAGAAAR